MVGFRLHAAVFEGAALLAMGGAVVAAGDEIVPRAALLEIDGPIGPATSDFLSRGLRRAEREGARLVVLRIDTPGGLDAATRDINQAILAAALPVVAYVAPAGARAASAGTFVVYASHVAAMAPATSLGAATPIALGGGELGAEGNPEDAAEADSQRKDDEETKPADATHDKIADKSPPDPARVPGPVSTLGRKAINDAAAYIRSLAELRGRDAEFAEAAVRNAATLTAREALERHVIDLIATDLDDLLAQLDGREVTVAGQSRRLATHGIIVQRIEPDWRNRLLAVITDPNVAYLLLLIGIYGLVFEGYSPGAILPGVVGGIALLLALYALQVLPVNYAGLALIVLGVGLFVTEIAVPNFGVLGIGGLVALVSGSILLMDVDVPGYRVSRGLIFGIAASSGIAFILALTLAARARLRPVVTGAAQILGQAAVAVEDFQGHGHVRVRGEIWQALSPDPVRAGQTVQVEAIEGLILLVRPEP